MKKITLLFAALGIILISSGNIFSQTQAEEAVKKENEKQGINSKSAPGEPVKGAEVFEEQERNNNSNAEGTKPEKGKKKDRKKGKGKKKRVKSKEKLDTSNCI